MSKRKNYGWGKNGPPKKPEIKEAVEEYLKRGGTIKKLVIGNSDQVAPGEDVQEIEIEKVDFSTFTHLPYCAC